MNLELGLTYALAVIWLMLFCMMAYEPDVRKVLFCSQT